MTRNLTNNSSSVCQALLKHTIVLIALSLTAACGSGGGGDGGGSSSGGAGLSAAPLPPAPISAAPISSAASFSCTFASSPTDCGFSEQAKVPGRASLVNFGRDGTTAVRLHTEPGDSNTFGSGTHERNDLSLSQQATDGYQGSEYWFAHSILFPDDFEIPPMSTETSWNWAAVFGWHHTASTGQGNFTVFVYPNTAITPNRPTGINFRGYGGTQDQGEFNAYVGPLVKNVWYDYVYHIRWSSGGDGFFEAWVNGVKKLSHRGPTLYSGLGVYLKPANYHTPTGNPSSVIHDRILRGSTALSVSPGPLEGVLTLVNGVLTQVQ
jgi:hypothetical protein